MKTMKLFLFAAFLAVSINTQAQVSINVNLGTPPVWAPAERVETQYYYLPEIQTYYDVPAQRFIYVRNGKWIRSAALPPRYKNYDLYHGRTVYITDYRGNSPYAHYKQHKVKYNNGNAYKNNRNGKGHGNSKGKGHGNGHGHGNK